MGIFRQYRCDGCGAEKREANHWWALSISEGNLMLMTLELYEAAMNVDSHGLPGDVLILCGQECGMKKVSAFMGGRATAADSQADGVKEGGGE